nr:ribonuclease H-like domain-containing protein [Tanacetum cinerariifolium]
RHLVEIHVIRAQFRKKTDKVANGYEVDEDSRPGSRDARIITFLHSEFAMTDMEEIRKRAHMQNCNPCRTPVDTESKLGSDGDPVCVYMHDPRDPYITALKRILRYVYGTLDHGLQLHVSSTTQLSAYTDA